MVDAYLGEIRLFAGLRTPMGWAECNGQILSVDAEPALFALIGNTYGGDGKKTFALPNLVGRIPVGVGPRTGTSGTVTTYTLGMQGGVNEVVLEVDDLPAHNHGLLATAKAATSTSPKGLILANPSDDFNMYVEYSAKGTKSAMSPQAIINEGNGLAHENMMPSIAIRYIICLVGIYPSFT